MLPKVGFIPFIELCKVLAMILLARLSMKSIRALMLNVTMRLQLGGTVTSPVHIPLVTVMAT
jgi:hypothetical protein